jgi:hypothetical protein
VQSISTAVAPMCAHRLELGVEQHRQIGQAKLRRLVEHVARRRAGRRITRRSRSKSIGRLVTGWFCRKKWCRPR